MGFFPQSMLVQTKPRESKVAKCGLCKLYKGCKSPKMKVFGQGRNQILVVGEAPGQTEDEQDRPFIGKAGGYLKKAFKQVGIDMDKDCWLTNSLICRPPNNATPTSEQIEYCRPNLKNALDDLQPKVIITVGRAAVEAVLYGLWTESFGALGRWVGWQIPSRDLNAWVCPTYHPSYILRETSGDFKRTPVEDIFLKHLKAAVRLKDRPYPKKPEPLEKQVRILMDSAEICRYLNKFRLNGGTCAFDLETNMLKPDSKRSMIRSAAICWRGKETIAFPMTKDLVIDAFKIWLKSPKGKKIAHNAKFEDRWCRDKLGVQIPNWSWCTMTQAHVHDNRKEVCSLSFQSMVWLGQKCYGQHISPMLGNNDSYGLNNIDKIDWKQLLLYNGMDALTTHMVANKQRNELVLRLA